MDKLRTTVTDFYTGIELFSRLKDKAGDPSGRMLQVAACRAKQIAEAKQYQYNRRTYSGDYIHRVPDTRTMTLSDFEQLGPRWVKEVHDINDRLPRGWYSDDICNDTVNAVVLCFTRGGSGGMGGNDNFNETKPKGRVVYMAGTHHSEWDGVTLDLDTTDDIGEAAQWADSMAEREAEACREEDEKYQREQEIEGLKEQISIARAKCLALLRDMRPLRKGLRDIPESICDALREQVSGYCESIADWRKELKELA